MLQGRFASDLSFRYFFRDDPAIDANEAAKKMNVTRLAFPNQVHGNRTIVVREESRGMIDADGITTDVPGLALAIRFADCQNFLVYVPEKKVVGLLHAGWKGMSLHAIEKFFEALKAEWDIDPSETFVLSGPSLCKTCAEFSDPLTELPAYLHAFVDGRHVDLVAAAEHIFDGLGIPKEHRERSSDCTKCNPSSYWSHRAMRNEMAEEKTPHRNFLVANLR